MSAPATLQANRHRLSSTTVGHAPDVSGVTARWFDVPREPFLEGTVTGIELIAEMLAVLRNHPGDGRARMEIQHTLAAVFAELYTGATGPENRKGAAQGAALALVDLLALASTRMDCIGYLQERANQAKAEADDHRARVEDDRRAFIERMQAGRATKQAQRQAAQLPEDFEQVRAGLAAAGFKLTRGEPPLDACRFYVERWGRARGFTRWAHVQNFLGIVGGKG